MFIVSLGIGNAIYASLITMAIASAVGVVVAIVAMIIGIILEITYDIPRIPFQVICVFLAVSAIALTIFLA